MHSADGVDVEWARAHFDHMSPEFAQRFHPTLGTMRAECPVTHSDQHGGYWIVTKYEDVYEVAQDWMSFSSEHGLSVPAGPIAVRNIPVEVDPPRQREYKRAQNPYLTPAAVAPWEPSTKALVNRLIDGFIEDGQCEFMHAFGHPLPALAFFENALGAPEDEVERVAYMASKSSAPNDPDAAECWRGLSQWIRSLIDGRRASAARGEPARGDVVDGVLGAEIDGRPYTNDEIIGTIQLLILGGLHTTAGALGMFIHRFCLEPEIPELLRRDPECIPAAIEELLRLDAPMVSIARTATRDTAIGGCPVAQGEKVMIYWSSANRDADHFEQPERFDLDRSSNRHLAFGVGPHRCAGSNIARLNLRVALEELVSRLHDIRLADGAVVEYHPGVNRAPITIPIEFTPGPRTGATSDRTPTQTRSTT